ncbi:MAG: response regulator transcription factor [Abitibacteriaceae bacterium]|nr:response regulator transcription factor [Abditibacteriaceae bacterium]MBV9866209.1 response regulator transcription factor [Abditibacteriaceae bacterium]
MNVLIVEDDESVARFLKQAAGEAGYVVQVVHDGLVALNTAQAHSFDLLLLDVMLPGLNGFEICRRLRENKIATPILIITARDALEDKIEGLDSGADDYIVKPFQVAELLARMRALLRRGVSTPTVLNVADLSLNPATRQAMRGGKLINLSATEYALLEYLMRNAHRVVTRSMILDHVWQYDFDGNDNVLDVYISYLRSKVDKGRTPVLIHTVRGVGYRIGTHANN